MRVHLLARLLRRGPTPDEAFDRFAGPLVRTPTAERKATSATVTPEQAPASALSSGVATPEQASALEGERRAVRRPRSQAPANPAARPGSARGRSESSSAPPR